MQQVAREDLDLIFKHALPSLKEMKGEKVFITGGTGFFGKWLLETFIHGNEEFDLGIELYLLSRNPKKFSNNFPHLANHSYIHWIEGDIENFEFPKVNCKYVIHAATDVESSLHGSSSNRISQSILAGTKRVLDFAKASQATKVLLTSSGAVYGPQPATVERLSESDLCRPNTDYGVGKLNSEKYAIEFEQLTGIEVKIARCFAFIGAYLPLDGKFAAGNFIQNALNNEDIIIKGDGTPLRSFLYCADLVIWLLKILTDGKSSNPYNVGSDCPVSINGLANEIASHCDSVSVNTLRPIDHSARKQRYIPSIEKSMKELELRVYTDLKDSISKTLNSLRSE